MEETKMTELERYYERYEKITKKYDKAYDVRDDKGLEEARVAYQELSSEIDSHGKIYAFIFERYRTSRERGNTLLDIDDNAGNQVKEMVEVLKKIGVQKFTFSSGWTDATTIAWKFVQEGCTIAGMTLVYGTKKIHFDERNTSPAYVFEIH